MYSYWSLNTVSISTLVVLFFLCVVFGNKSKFLLFPPFFFYKVQLVSVFPFSFSLKPSSNNASSNPLPFETVFSTSFECLFGSSIWSWTLEICWIVVLSSPLYFELHDRQKKSKKRKKNDKEGKNDEVTGDVGTAVVMEDQKKLSEVANGEADQLLPQEPPKDNKLDLYPFLV